MNNGKSLRKSVTLLKKGKSSHVTDSSSEVWLIVAKLIATNYCGNLVGSRFCLVSLNLTQ